MSLTTKLLEKVGSHGHVYDLPDPAIHDLWTRGGVHDLLYCTSRPEIEAAVEVLIAHKTPTVLLLIGAQVGTTPAITVINQPFIGPVTLWNNLVIALGSTAALWRTHPDKATPNAIKLKQIIAIAQAVHETKSTPPWLHQSKIGSVNLTGVSGFWFIDRLFNVSPALQHIIQEAWCRAIQIIGSHTRELQELYTFLVRHGDIDILEIQKILGPRPVLYPLMNVLAEFQSNRRPH